MMHNLRRVDSYIALMVIILTITIFIFGFINYTKTSIIDFDSGINATACLNLVNDNIFRPNFFKTDICDTYISTGLPILLPTSLLYKFIGVNSSTTILIPFLYFIASYLLLLFIGFYLFYNMKSIYSMLISILFIQDTVLWYTATHLLGETASLFFILLSICIIIKYYKSRHNNSIYLLLLGICISLSISCKLLSILFVVVELICFIVWYLFYLKQRASKLLWIIVGAFFVLILCITFRYYQFRSISLAIENLILYVKEMFYQGKQKHIEAIIGSDIIERFFLKLPIFFCDFSRFYVFHPIILIIIPYIIILYKIYSKELDIKSLVCVTMGISSGTLFLYWCLFAPPSLLYRRCIIYSFLLRISFVLVLCMIIKNLISLLYCKCVYKRIAIIVSICLLCNCNFNWYDVASNIVRFSATDNQHLIEYSMYKSLSDEIKQLKNQRAILTYLYGYNLPYIDLYEFYEMEPINDYSTVEKMLNCSFNNCYFIVGNMWPENFSINELSAYFGLNFERISQTDVDSFMISQPMLDGNTKLYSIYKIIP